MGMGLDNMVCVHGVAQLQLLLGHLNKRDRTGQLIQIDRDYVELLVGTGVFPLANLSVSSLSHSPTMWVTSICGYLYSVGGAAVTNFKQVISFQRENNHFIMQLAIDSNFCIKSIQQCCLWLQVATLADVLEIKLKR